MLPAELETAPYEGSMKIQNKAAKSFLRHLHNIKAFEEHVDVGKRLASHQKDPSAPLSTFFFNLRSPMSAGEKKGPLSEEDIRSIASEIFQKVLKAGLQFDAVAGIPHAGDPLAIAFAEAYERVYNKPLKIIRLQKETGARGQTLIRVYDGDRPSKKKKADAPRQRVLVLDDLITKADTKWLAINALRRVHFEVAGVAVFIDREQGGATELRRSGVPLTSVYTAKDVIMFLRDDDLISRKNFEIHMDYLARTKR